MLCPERKKKCSREEKYSIEVSLSCALVSQPLKKTLLTTPATNQPNSTPSIARTVNSTQSSIGQRVEREVETPRVREMSSVRDNIVGQSSSTT